MTAPTVCFVARRDLEAVPGGDTVQWQMYSSAAQAAGLGTRAWFDDAPLPQCDVIHAFNLDRPLDLYPKLVRAKRAGIPFVLSTIHHPHEWLLRARRIQLPAGVLGRAIERSPLGRSVAITETAKEAATLLLQGRFSNLGALFPAWTTRARWLLAHADRIALLTESEAAAISTDFGYDVRDDQKFVLPNWVEGTGQPASSPPAGFEQLSEAPVIVVGRIEPRKNSLRICELAERARRPVVFLGRALPGKRRYLESFEAAVARGRFARWIAGVPREEMAGYYRWSSFLLNASLIEISPLVDIEALAFGCPIATTQYALHHGLLPPNTPILDPYDDESILARLSWRPERLAPRQVVDGQAAREALVASYLRLVEAARGGRPEGRRAAP